MKQLFLLLLLITTAVNAQTFMRVPQDCIRIQDQASCIDKTEFAQLNGSTVVQGPASAVDDCIPTFDLTTGKIIQCNSTATITDASVFSITGQFNADNIRIDGGTLSSTSGNITITPLTTSDLILGGGGTVVVTDTNRIGIGTTAPNAGLNVYGTDSTSASIRIDRASDDTVAPSMVFVKRRTAGYPNSSDVLLSINAQSTDGSGVGASVASNAIVSVATEAQSASAGGRDLRLYSVENGSTSTSTRMIIANNGEVGVGGSTPTAALDMMKNITGSTSEIGLYARGVVQSDVTSAAYSIRSNTGTAVASFTLADLIHFYASQGTFGAGSTVTNQYGYLAPSNLTGATNNFGFRSNIAAASGRWNFYAGGTAANYFAGQTSIGTTSPNADAQLQGDSTSQYWLPPRMTTAQRTGMTITTADDGGYVYDTDIDALYVVQNGAWAKIDSVAAVSTTVTAPTLSNPKICYYGFGGASATLAAPTECTTGTCVEVVDTCAAGTPPTFGATAVYSNMTFANGTWANSSLIECSCTAWDTTTSDPKQCRMYFVTNDDTWSTNTSGGYETSVTTYNESGTQETSYVLIKCLGSSP